jgi:uncharacterized protein (DUF697 family)/predicted GTPase
MVMLGKVWQWVKRPFSPSLSDEEVKQHFDRWKALAPTPVFWMFGKTQSGKSSIVRFITGAEKAEIGKGFMPCTRFSSRYVFPSEQTPLMTFLDTRGLDEPTYDPAEDIAAFDKEAHLIVVVVKALDHAQQTVVASLKRIREAMPRRPILLALTCLHEAYPQQQHPLPYPFGRDATLAAERPPQLDQLMISIDEQKARFAGLYDRLVAVDLTPAEEGFNEANYGGEALKELLLELLPAAEAQSVRTLAAAQADLHDVYARKAIPTIVAYSSLAGTAGAIPVPLVDMVLLSAAQTRMVYDLANLYGQPLTKQRFVELTSALGLGLLSRQTGNMLIKLIPGVGTVIGSVAGGALAAASTYALGKAFCYYYRAVLEGRVPDAADLKRYYHEQLASAEKAWRSWWTTAPKATPPEETKA